MSPGARTRTLRRAVRARSLRARVMCVVVAATVLAMSLAAFVAYRGVGGLLGEELEHALVDRARTDLVVLDAGRVPPSRPGTVEQVLAPDGRVRPLTGPDAVRLPVSAGAREVARSGAGESREDLVAADGVEYGILTLPMPGRAEGALMVGQSYAGAQRLDTAFQWRIAGTTAAATGAAVLLGWLVLGRVLRPVRRLARSVRRITDTGDLAAPLPPAGDDEIGQLTADVAAMLAALRRSRAAQRQLVQDAGHELRTPLTSIRGSAELLQRARGRLAAADEAQVLDTLVAETAALDGLVREIVELAGDRHVGERPAILSLGVEAREAAERWRRRTGRPITVTGPDPERAGPWVRARPGALRRCLDNLLGNAVKFGPEGSPVTVRVTADGGVVVEDRGPGIPAAERRAVFDRFHRGPGTQGTPGSGLGLAIVRDLVTLDGGTVLADAAPGGGAAVGFRLPRVPGPAPAAGPGPAPVDTGR
ncbi:ATP-binding protein (plasmid) [Streptomyces sp. BI20]|uniref:sensor histidine kinase n=1 Tax=Streptomyces sp. BI20 TaxID=3403460 RepID=UPI003C790D98